MVRAKLELEPIKLDALRRSLSAGSACRVEERIVSGRVALVEEDWRQASRRSNKRRLDTHCCSSLSLSQLETAALLAAFLAGFLQHFLLANAAVKFVRRAGKK